MWMIFGTSTRPSAPKDVVVGARSDKSLEIRWEGTVGTCYVLEIRYYELGGPMVDANFEHVREVKALAAHVLHPESLSKASGWVVKVELKAKSEDRRLLSDPVMKQITWDGEISADATQNDLKERIDYLERTEVQGFLSIRKKQPKFVVLGGQHHGKSSFVNHLYRCLRCDLSLNDQMDVASAGSEEKTLVTKSLAVPLTAPEISFIDTPAFANMNGETAAKLKVLLSMGLQDGARREALASAEHSLFGLFSEPPHGAVVVMSLCHWRDQTEEMQSYLEKMAETFKGASRGNVAFPYVVACTHRDVFLKDCQKEDPAKELQKAVDGIRKAALTDHVYPIRCYKKEETGSLRNNKATFDLLCQLLDKAKHENTAKVQEQDCLLAISVMISLMILLVTMVVCPPLALFLILCLAGAVAGAVSGLFGKPVTHL